MAGFVKGDIVVIPFPFSDLTYTKKRPALINIILYQIGHLKPKKMNEIVEKIIAILRK